MDTINHPPHYISNGIESIAVIEAFTLNFHLGNVIKYVLRADRKKSTPLNDLKKARWYLDREIQNREKLIVDDDDEPLPRRVPRP